MATISAFGTWALWVFYSVIYALAGACLAAVVVVVDGSPRHFDGVSMRGAAIVWQGSAMALGALAIVKLIAQYSEGAQRQKLLAALRGDTQEVLVLAMDLAGREVASNTQKLLLPVLSGACSSEIATPEEFAPFTDEERAYLYAVQERNEKDHERKTQAKKGKAKGDRGQKYAQGSLLATPVSHHVLLTFIERRLVVHTQANTSLRMMFASIRANTGALASSYVRADIMRPLGWTLSALVVLWSGTLASPLLASDFVTTRGWAIGYAAVVSFAWGLLITSSVYLDAFVGNGVVGVQSMLHKPLSQVAAVMSPEWNGVVGGGSVQKPTTGRRGSNTNPVSFADVTPGGGGGEDGARGVSVPRVASFMGRSPPGGGTSTRAVGQGSPSPVYGSAREPQQQQRRNRPHRAGTSPVGRAPAGIPIPLSFSPAGSGSPGRGSGGGIRSPTVLSPTTTFNDITYPGSRDPLVGSGRRGVPPSPLAGTKAAPSPPTPPVHAGGAGGGGTPLNAKNLQQQQQQQQYARLPRSPRAVERSPPGGGVTTPPITPSRDHPIHQRKRQQQQLSAAGNDHDAGATHVSPGSTLTPTRGASTGRAPSGSALAPRVATQPAALSPLKMVNAGARLGSPARATTRVSPRRSADLPRFEDDDDSSGSGSGNIKRRADDAERPSPPRFQSPSRASAQPTSATRAKAARPDALAQPASPSAVEIRADDSLPSTSPLTPVSDDTPVRVRVDGGGEGATDGGDAGPPRNVRTPTPPPPPKDLEASAGSDDGTWI